MTYKDNAPDLLKRGIEVFNNGEYYEAHELWEELWKQTSGPIRGFYQGLIHAAVGLHHLVRGNATGAASQLTKSMRKLKDYPPRCCGINNRALQVALEDVLIRMAPTPVRIFAEDGVDDANQS